MTLLIPKIQRPRHLIDPVAFFIALIGGPILFTALTFWALLIPVGALIFGGPVYLVVGTPLLLIHLRRNPATVDGISWLAVNAVYVGASVLAFVMIVIDGIGTIWTSFMVFLLALIFALFWSNAFARIYLKLQRDFYTCPHAF